MSRPTHPATALTVTIEHAAALARTEEMRRDAARRRLATAAMSQGPDAASRRRWQTGWSRACRRRVHTITTTEEVSK